MARGPIGRERLARLPRCDLGLGQEGRVGLFQIDPVFVRIRAHACRPPPKLPTPLLHRAPWISRLAVTKLAIETHQARLGRTPRLVAADAAFYSAKNEAAARAKGVKRICIPNRSTKSAERKREQRKRWFRDGQKWRTGQDEQAIQQS